MSADGFSNGTGRWFKFDGKAIASLHGVEAVVTMEQAAAFISPEQKYEFAFVMECLNEYPTVDQFERDMGFAIDRQKMERAARVMACPVKANPPNWQHGRVIYAAVRNYLAQSDAVPFNLLDIGTAKGFSALCAHWALVDSGKLGQVVSVDVIDPAGTEKRNTVAELNGPVTLAQIHEPWPEAKDIVFVKSTGVDRLRRDPSRIHVAFVDGKHSGAVVAEETRLLAARQAQGDLVIFDDAQIPAVELAIRSAAKPVYQLTDLTVKDGRAYVIGRRK